MTTARYPDWFAALGQPIPDENRAHLQQIRACAELCCPPLVPDRG